MKKILYPSVDIRSINHSQNIRKGRSCLIIKRVVICAVALILALVLFLISVVIARAVHARIIYPVPVLWELNDREELNGVLEYLQNEEKFIYDFAIFDYDGDKFDISYAVLAHGAKQNSKDVYDFLSPKACRASVFGYIAIDGYKCQCFEDENDLLYDYSRGHEDCLLIKYEMDLHQRHHVPEITDRSLLTIEENERTADLSYREYYVKYDGVNILRFQLAVPLDEEIKSLFTDHLIIYYD